MNVSLWLQHIVMFAMLKIDRVLASCLPFGRYPLLSVEIVTAIIISAWVLAFFVAALVTVLFKSSYEPAVVLCIPELPIGNSVNKVTWATRVVTSCQRNSVTLQGFSSPSLPCTVLSFLAW